MNLFTLLNEDADKAKGSKKGREKYASKEGAKGKGAVKSGKSRVRVFATIAKALEQGHVGQIFSTKGSDRLYVVSRLVGVRRVVAKLLRDLLPVLLPLHRIGRV